MNLQALRVFVTVAREGSLTRAAQALHLTQPAVGLQVKNLQDKTGVRLFTRTAQGMRLTAEGAALLPVAEQALRAHALFQRTVARMHQEVRGALRLGTILDPSFTRLGALLKALLDLAPQVGITLSHGMSGEVLARVLRDELDAGYYLTVPPQEGLPDLPAPEAAQGIAVRPLTRFRYRVLAPAGWEPQVRERDWAGLAALPWLATPAASAHHRLLGRVFGPGSLTGLQARQVAMVDQEASMLDLVKSGVGLSLVRDHIALAQAQAHGLVVVEELALDCVLSFAYKAARVDEPVIQAALNALDAAWPAPFVAA